MSQGEEWFHSTDISAGTSGDEKYDLSNEIYKVKITILLLLRGVSKAEGFVLAPRVSIPGMHDDLIFKCFYRKSKNEEITSKTWFIHLKNEQTTKITKDDLLSKNGEFSLSKYCSLFQKMKDYCKKDKRLNSSYKDDNCEYVVYTTGTVTKEIAKHIKPQCDWPNDILNSGSSRNVVVSFDDNSDADIFPALEDLSSNKEILCELIASMSNAENKMTEKHAGLTSIANPSIASEFNCIEDTLTATDVEELLKDMSEMEISAYRTTLPKINIFTEQSAEQQLDKLILLEIQEACHVSDAGARYLYSQLLQGLTQWSNSNTYYLTEENEIWQNILSMIHKACNISEPQCHSVSKLMIQFFKYPLADIEAVMLNSKVTNVIARPETFKLSCLKVYQVVEDIYPQRYIFVSLKVLIKQKSEIFLLWPSQWCTALVVVCQPICANIEELCNELTPLIFNEEAKIILISVEDNNFVYFLQQAVINSYTEIRDNCHITDLNDKSQQYLLEKEVIFQGYPVPFHSLMRSHAELSDVIDASVLSKLLNTTHPLSLGLGLSKPIDFCIPRTLECVIHINKNVLRANSLCGVLAITNATLSDLTHLMIPSDRICQVSDSTSDVDVECRLFILIPSESINVFDKLCSFLPGKNVHHLALDKNMLIWKETKGDPGCLRDYICKRTITAHPKEVTAYMANCLKSTHQLSNVFDVADNTVVLVGNPGMGKSTLLTSLAHGTKLKAPEFWVIYIDLKVLGMHFPETMSEDYNFTDVLELLCSTLNINGSSTGRFEYMLLEQSLQSKGNVIVLIDGLEEISSSQRKKALNFISGLKKTKISKLWVTCTTAMEHCLLKLLNVVPYTLQPFTQSVQRNFLLLRWMSIFSDMEEVDSFIEKLQEVNQEYSGEHMFSLGIPLHIVIATEVFEKNLAYFISGSPMCMPETMSLFQLYDNFVNTKLEMYYHTQVMETNSGIQWKVSEVAEQFKTNHMLCALLLLFEKAELQELQIGHITETVSAFVNRITKGQEQSGLIHIIEGKPQFIHYSFAEYFVGMWLFHNYQRCKIFIQDRILDTSFSFIRSVLDWFMVREHNLHIAVMNNDLNTVKHLVNMKTDINNVDDAGRTPLHLAVLYSRTISSLQTKKHGGDNDNTCNPIINLLLDKGANAKAIDFYNNKPIWYAVVLKKWDALDLLLRGKVDIKEICFMKKSLNKKQFLQEGLLVACKNGYFNLMEGFSLCGVEFQDYFIEYEDILCNPLHIAAKFGRVKLIRYLLSKKVNHSICDKRGYTPLHFAVCEGMLEAVLYLVQRGSAKDACDKEGNTPLNQAVWWGDFQTVLFLVDHIGCNINLGNKYGDTPLHRAVGSGYQSIVEYLLLRGASVNSRNKEGNSPLHRAAWLGNLQILQILLANGANVNLCNNNGDTALSQSAGGGRLDIVQCLVENGAEVAVQAGNGNTALHWAARQNAVEVLKYLLNKGADINAQNRYGNTPLHHAVEHGSTEAVKYLKKEGSSMNIMNNSGYTANTIKGRNALKVEK